MERPPTGTIQAEMGRKYKENRNVEIKEGGKDSSQARTDNPAEPNLQREKRSAATGSQTW